MLILDNKKDYYDYVSGVYGMDEKIVYKRHGKNLQHEFFPCENNRAYLFLEICNTWYIIRIDVEQRMDGNEKCGNLSFMYDKILDINLVCQKDIKNEDKLGDVSILIPMIGYSYIRYRFFQGSKKFFNISKSLHDYEYDEMIQLLFSTETPTEIKNILKIGSMKRPHGMFPDRIIENPILGELGFGSIVPAEDMFIKIQNYLSSKINDGIETKMDDNKKIESHGFCNKRSFRPKIKT